MKVVYCIRKNCNTRMTYRRNFPTRTNPSTGQWVGEDIYVCPKCGFMTFKDSLNKMNNRLILIQIGVVKNGFKRRVQKKLV